MLTFENVLEIFQEYLLRDRRRSSSLQTRLCPTAWDKDSRYCVEAFSAGPRRNCLIYFSRIDRTMLICRTRGRREVQRADEKAVENCASHTWTGGRRR